MANVKISDLTENTSPGVDDLFEMETSGGAARKVKRANLFVKARAYLGSAANTTTSWSKVPLADVAHDVSSIWNAGSTRFIPNKAGYYLCTLRVRTGSAGSIAVAIAKNGSNVFALGPDSTGDLATGGTAMIQVNGSTDYLEMFHIANNVRAFTTGDFDTYMEVLGPF